MEYTKIASDSVIEKTVKALKERNIQAIVVNTKEEALEKIKELIPQGGSVMNSSSTTLNEIDFVDYLKDGQHGWDNVHANILNEKDKSKQSRLRKESVLADYFLGSVHAITENGQLVIASASGSQMPSYAFTSDNVIWVAGTQKIVPTLDVALARIRDYVVPLEDARVKNIGYPGTTWARTLIIENEIMPNRHLTMILVKEKLGF